METLLHELNDFITRRFRLNKRGVGFIKVQQLLREITHPEEIVLLVKNLYRFRVNGTYLDSDKFTRTINEVGIRFVLFATHTIRTLIFTGVDKAFVEEILQELLDVVFVAGFGGANEIVIRNVDGIEQGLPRVLHQTVNPVLGR